MPSPDVLQVDMADTTYRYHDTPLAQPDKQFRLLTLHQDDTGNSEIRASLAVHALEDCTPYAAISYTWGDRLPTLTIRINGQAFVVHHNCWYALWQMRHHRHHTTFWIDQICIDQQNPKEKPAQVAAMGSIYGGATMVASCLGSGRTLVALQNFDAREKDTTVTTRDAFEALDTLQHNPYFNRLWIKQEVILGSLVRLYCGINWMDWDDFESITQSIKPARLRSTKTSDRHLKSLTATPVNHTRLIEGRRQHGLGAHVPNSNEGGDAEVKPQPWTSLWQTLMEYGDSHCHLPHDKVYALLPLIPQAARKELELPIDYDSPLLPLALRLVRNVLQEAASGTNNDLTPASTWTAAMRLVHEWFQLSPSSPGVADFLAERSFPLATTIQISFTTVEQAENSPLYCPLIILDRFPITQPFEQASDEEDQSDATLLLERFPVTRRFEEASDEEDDGDALVPLDITDELPLSAIRPHLISRGFHRTKSQCEEWGEGEDAVSRSSLGALPPDLPAKIVQFTYRFSAAFLVPASTMLGDEILHCEYADPRSKKRFGYMPIVRRCTVNTKGADISPSEQQYATLIGWAQRVDQLGRLEHRTLQPVLPNETPDWESSGFNLHYEDLMLLAMLEDIPGATLTHGCMQSDHPSFLWESVNATATHDGVLQIRFEDPVSREAEEAAGKYSGTTGNAWLKVD